MILPTLTVVSLVYNLKWIPSRYCKLSANLTHSRLLFIDESDNELKKLMKLLRLQNARLFARANDVLIESITELCLRGIVRLREGDFWSEIDRGWNDSRGIVGRFAAAAAQVPILQRGDDFRNLGEPKFSDVRHAELGHVDYEVPEKCKFRTWWLGFPR